MAEQDKTAIAQINLALAGIEAELSVIRAHTVREEVDRAAVRAEEYLEQAKQHLITIQFHLQQVI